LSGKYGGAAPCQEKHGVEFETNQSGMSQRMTRVYCEHASVQVYAWERLFMNT